jgi:hypothetical protein
MRIHYMRNQEAFKDLLGNGLVGGYLFGGCIFG